ncbi:Flavin-dependent oxidoreductase, luciferase family (includes alkanesulfonate monooxygenase SsuD and methylene tetrahydromethanopterin reductase) [Thiohalospira halophila DSM 15071]|uniref:Flavin-dependent oxidoreductase, luciferase family (Includes alkanesulfonate monooxygenase SsuD and methylene tetrahydromethanopterin reductase) n=1 Tax=Thiohalospira halophila DSM 15071 TaxID=1123397 RepID=A0A1I1QUB4_9GAMM|nr:LLM class flavin-dependent oxidoreductase [Thiohalospira halophila]SFD25669.1 Flavin-dependent oxidoreductase, luciferase family (includes alkanesulfonate monooxygenase SsuD and methylene tetrahydromethanopterin reductase) [Thiohalospira halophila DSM 15071]
MRFDLFNELSVPAHGQRDERQVFRETLEEWALADELGFDTAWLVEHHFMPEYSHATAPALFLAAAAQRTRRMRLGHAVVPLPYHHPVRVAESTATLDVLSEGRVEFGFGRGFSPSEYAAFGVRMADSRTLTAESLAICRQAWAEGRVDHHGDHWDFDDLAVTPRPLQQPHPPLWSAAVSPESFELAGSEGIGALAGPFKPWFMVREDIRRYREAFTAAGHPAGVEPRVGMTLGIFCLPDGREARRLARPAVEWFYGHLLGQTRPVLKSLYEGYEYYQKWGRWRPLLERAVSLRLLEALGMVIVGDPAHCRRRLAELAEAGVDHTLCAVGAGALPTGETRRSLHTLAEEVIPALREP